MEKLEENEEYELDWMTENSENSDWQDGDRTLGSLVMTERGWFGSDLH